MSNLLQEIEAQIAGAKLATAKQNVGTVREIGDGVAKIEGLTDAMLNEMLDFGSGTALSTQAACCSSSSFTSRCSRERIST